MRAEKVIYSLLSSKAAITNLVGTRIFPAPAPQDAALPCITYSHVSTVALQPTVLSVGDKLVRTLIDVAPIAKTYADQKNLVEQIRLALEFEHGTIAGVDVTSILRGSVGPDTRDDDLQMYTQSIEFVVTLVET